MNDDRRNFIQQVSLAGIAAVLPEKLTTMHRNKGITIKKSDFSVGKTVTRLIGLVKVKGISIYADIDQQKEMYLIGKTISPMRLLIFGNPKVGSLILSDNPLAGLDLPLKVLIWEDAKQDVYLAYNNSGFLKERYNLKLEISKLLDLDALVMAALEG